MNNSQNNVLCYINGLNLLNFTFIWVFFSGTELLKAAPVKTALAVYPHAKIQTDLARVLAAGQHHRSATNCSSTGRPDSRNVQ